MQKILFDTDPGVDDAAALLLLSRSPDIDLVGITTVYGNGTLDQVTHNARYLAALFGLHVPIARGAGEPLEGAAGPPPAHVHGKNALGDVEGPQVSMRDEDNRFAHQLILDLVQAHPGEITIIAVGRLTNLALALRAAPHIAGLVKRIVVMGGAFGLGGPHGRPSGGPNGNVTPVAEANVFGDALAADEVLAASWPVTLVGLDATTKVVLTRADIEAMAGSDNAAVGFVGRAKRLYADYYARSGLDGCFVHDSSALICALQPQHFTLRKGPVTVVRGGPAHGQTLQVVNPGTYLAQDWFDRPAHDVATAADGERVREHFLRMMGQP